MRVISDMEQIEVKKDDGNIEIWNIVGETENTFTIEKWGRVTSIDKKQVKINSNNGKLYLGQFHLPPVDETFNNEVQEWVMEGIV